MDVGRHIKKISCYCERTTERAIRTIIMILRGVSQLLRYSVLLCIRTDALFVRAGDGCFEGAGSMLCLEMGKEREREMKWIGVLSDTHGKLRDEVAEILRGCDVILHAGDINIPEVMERLQEIAPLYIVRGNADKEWAEGLPESLSEEICGLRVFMVHNKKHMPEEMENYDLVVFGHSHKYEERRQGACLYLNPGSCGPRRFSQPVTMAVLEVENGEIRVIRKDIIQETQRTADKRSGRKAAEEMGKEAGQQFFAERLHLILRDVDRGRSVSEIVAKHEMAEETAEQICRLYLTHPGIDAAGVMDKMGLPGNR